MEKSKWRNLSFLFVCGVLLVTLPAMVSAVHEPPGIRSNSGSVSSGSFSAFLDAYTTVYNPRTVYDYTGDLYTKGHSLSGNHKLIYYCIIKISPADATHKYLEIKIDADFEYGMSCSWWALAKWELQIGMFDMETSNIIQRGWIENEPIGESIGGFWPETLDDQHWHSLDTFYRIMDRPYFELNQFIPLDQQRLEFSHTQWYYVGMKLTITLNGASDIYETSNAAGNAHFNPDYIYWHFEE